MNYLNKTAILLSFLALASCATAKPRHLDGMCMHPAANGGAPFMISERTLFDGTNIVAFTEDGGEVILVGAVCQLQVPAPTASKK